MQINYHRSRTETKIRGLTLLKCHLPATIYQRLTIVKWLSFPVGLCVPSTWAIRNHLLSLQFSSLEKFLYFVLHWVIERPTCQPASQPASKPTSRPVLLVWSTQTPHNSSRRENDKPSQTKNKTVHSFINEAIICRQLDVFNPPYPDSITTDIVRVCVDKQKRNLSVARLAQQ